MYKTVCTKPWLKPMVLCMQTHVHKTVVLAHGLCMLQAWRAARPIKASCWACVKGIKMWDHNHYHQYHSYSYCLSSFGVYIFSIVSTVAWLPRCLRRHPRPFKVFPSPRPWWSRSSSTRTRVSSRHIWWTRRERAAREDGGGRKRLCGQLIVDGDDGRTRIKDEWGTTQQPLRARSKKSTI